MRLTLVCLNPRARAHLGLALGLATLPACDPPRPAPEERPSPAATSPSTTPDPAALEAAAAERRARFEARSQVTPPAGLPAPWRALPEHLGGKLTGASVKERTGKDGVREIHLQIRSFDQDAAVERAVLAALKHLKLPRIPAALGPDGTAEGPGWSLEIGRLKAPPGVPREHRIELTWRNQTPDPAPRGDCKQHLPAVDAPPRLPGWLGQVTRPQIHRWRVARETSAYPKLDRVRLWMLYRTGYTQDEHVGQLQAGATAQGYTRVEGVGPTQRWRHPDGPSLSWRPSPGPLGVDCKPDGPAIEITWERPGGPP